MKVIEAVITAAFSSFFTFLLSREAVSMMNYLLLLTIKSGEGFENFKSKPRKKQRRSFTSELWYLVFLVRHTGRMKALRRLVKV